MPQRKVLFFTQSAAYGGDDTVLIEIVKHWPNPNDRLVVAINSSHPGRNIYRASLAGKAELLLINERTVPQEKEGLSRVGTLAYQISRTWRAPASIRRMQRWIAAQSPDILLVSSGGFPISSLTWRVLAAARFQRIPYLVSIHSNPHIRGFAHRWLQIPLNRWIAAKALRVITVSESCSNELLKELGAPRPICIANGLNSRTPDQSVEEKYRLLGNPSRPLIGAISNIEERKGFHVFIGAMARIAREIPEASAVIIGAVNEPEYRRRLDEMIPGLGLKGRVVMTGFLRDAGRFAACFDALVIPSIQYESFGLAALEAMRYGKPVVATRMGGIPEVVSDGKTGLLVPAGDAGAMAEAVLRILKSPELAANLGAAGNEAFTTKFTAQRMARQYYDLTLAQG